MTTNQQMLPVLVEIVGKGGGSIGVAQISVATLRENLHSATSMLAQALSDIRGVGDFELAEVEVGVEISAEGGVQFIGTSKVSGSGSITLTFKKP